MGLNWKCGIQWPRSNGSYSLHLLNANIWLPSGSFNLRKSSQISQSHSNPSFSLMISWHNYFVCVTWTVDHSSRCRTIYPAAQRWHLEASSTSGSWILFRNIMLLLLYFLSPGLGLLILPKLYFWNHQPRSTPKVKWISLRLKEMPLHVTRNSCQHGNKRGVSK